MLSQKIIIEKWLHDYGSITGKEALEKCGIYRLSDCIFRIREHHKVINSKWEIKTTYFDVTNPHTGRVSKPAKYVLQEKK
tara:strand:+ start:466 stop:705 length:240 start_codon:yes stop_codon:yes gene_type:complete